MGICIEHNTSRTVRDPHNDTGNDRPLEPEFCFGRIAALDVAHHMIDAAVQVDLRLPIEIDVRANPQYRRR